MKKFLILLGILYVLISAVLFFLQEQFIFKPHPIPQEQIISGGQEVLIPIDDKIDMHCLWVKNGSKKVILYFHGNTGNVRRANYQANRFNRGDNDIFIPDYRSYGKSKGQLTNGRQLLSDAERSYTFLKKHYSEDNIVIVGYSLGSGIASHVAKNQNPHHLVLVAPFTSLADIKNTYLWMFPDFLLKYKLSNKDHLKEVTCPVTLIHGTDDKVVQYKFSTELNKLYPHSRLVTKEGAGHRRVIFGIGQEIHSIMG